MKETDYKNCKCGRAIHPIIEDVCPKFMKYHTKLEARKSRSKNKSVASALANFAERASKMPHKHWYLKLDKKRNVTLVPEEKGKHLQDAAATTIQTVKQKIAEEIEPIIKLRSQGTWEDTGCSVVPTRYVIGLYEKLSGRKYK